MSLDPYTRNQGTELQNKVNTLQLDVEQSIVDISQNATDIAQLQASGVGATVGTGGRYSSIQEALDAGETSMEIVSDLAVTSDLVAPVGPDISVSIVINNSHTVTFSDAAFKASNRFDNVSLEGSIPIPVLRTFGATPPTYGANVVINFTNVSHSNTGVLDSLDGVVAKNLIVTDTSTQEVVSLINECTEAVVDTVHYTIQEPVARDDASISATSMMLNNFTSVVQNASSALVVAVSDLCAQYCQFTTVSSQLGGGAYVLLTAEGYFEKCDFSGVTVSIEDFIASFVNCRFTQSLVEGSFPGTGELEYAAFFSACFIEPPYDWEISSTNGSFQGGFIDPSLITTQSLTLSGTKVTLTNVAITMDSVTISGDQCGLVGCVSSSYNLNTPDFAVSVTAAATDTRLIGNAFTAALSDLGTGTQNVGNTT